VDIIRAMESIQEGTETLEAYSLGYYVLQKQKPLSEKNVQKEKGNVQIKCCVYCLNIHYLIHPYWVQIFSLVLYFKIQSFGPIWIMSMSTMQSAIL